MFTVCVLLFSMLSNINASYIQQHTKINWSITTIYNPNQTWDNKSRTTFHSYSTHFFGLWPNIYHIEKMYIEPLLPPYYGKHQSPWPLSPLFHIRVPYAPTTKKELALVFQDLCTRAFFITLLRASKIRNYIKNDDNDANDNEITPILIFAIRLHDNNFWYEYLLTHCTFHLLFFWIHIQNWKFPASPWANAESTNFYGHTENSYFLPIIFLLTHSKLVISHISMC